jgi:NAD(P)H-flavin reductase
MKIIHCDIVASMKSVQTALIRIIQNGPATCYEFADDQLNGLEPGQYIMAHGDSDILPIPLYPCGLKESQYTSLVTTSQNWRPGDLLTIRFPLGKGFSLPGTVKRLLMVSGTNNPLRLIPVASRVIEEGGEAAFFTYHLPDRLPVEIEVLTRDQVAEAITWADGIIGDIPLSRLLIWKNLIAGEGSIPQKKTIQVLVDTPMACGGTADCGVCAVKTRHGWMHACTDGPVFPLSELEF